MRRISNRSQQRLFRGEILSLTLKNAKAAFFSLIVCAAAGGVIGSVNGMKIF
ncbi:MAG: hypothetical protein NC548_17785 [Lachnospiraceae bacterium]|nr:hypothetical protein [Lachnospiraceae bacterium]